MRKTGIACILMILCLMLGSFALAEEPFALIGEWAYETDASALVLSIREDGTGWFQDTECEWEDLGDFLRLTDEEGVEMLLRYDISEEKKVIYPQTVYRRGAEVEDQGGLIGVWEGLTTGSSFVFTPAGAFLEDNVFSGEFTADPEAGSFLLHYEGGIFADTTCYYSIEHDAFLTVEYPWTIVARQE